MYDGPGRSALKIRQYCPGNVDYPSILSSGSEAFIRYSSIVSGVDTRFEIKITSVACKLSNILKLKQNISIN